jgi:NAD(P)-dependent dehydrogenase (short-subunit alcohol dehydrogenase family)
MRFEGKTVLITGGATGIGRATAQAFAREGAAVMIGDVDDRAAETVSLIEAEGGKAAFKKADVTDALAMTELVRDCVARFGGMHMAFNNAGVLPPPLPFMKCRRAIWITS